MANPFKRVIVDYLIAGNTRITWEFDSHFTDISPYVFQLQSSNAAGVNNEADDWVNVGTTHTDVIQLIDTYSATAIRTQHGKTNMLAYRIRLSTPSGLYYSEPAQPMGKFDKFDWVMAREIIRKEFLRFRLNAGIRGFFLKAKRFGEVCDCVDPLTGEVTDSNCTTCYGTGLVTGFFEPIDSFFVDVTPSEAREHRDLKMKGTEKTEITSGRMIAVPGIIQGDAFVADGSDDRFYVHTVKELANWRNVSLVVSVELRLAPFTDVIYKIEVPEIA